MRAPRVTSTRCAIACLVIGACTFPDYDVTSGSSSGGANASSSSTTSGMQSTTTAQTTTTTTDAVSSTSDATSTSSSASSSDASASSSDASSTGMGGMGGAGGASTASGGSTADASSSSTGSGPLMCKDTTCQAGSDPTCITTCVGATPNDCDCDGDGAHRNAPECNGMAGSVDCYDCNPAAKVGQTAFFFKNRGDGSFDYDCNMASEPKYTTTCPSVSPCSSGKAYSSFQACGVAADLFDCQGILSMCSKATTFTPSATQGCR